jgi:hypothetical protein
MNIKTRVERLEEAASHFDYDLTLLTDAELLTLNDCYTEGGELLPERVTPELVAALERVKL